MQDGNIPLHLACEANCPQLVEALYEFGGFSPYAYNDVSFTEHLVGDYTYVAR